MSFYDYLVNSMETLDDLGRKCIESGYYEYLDLIGPLLNKIYNDIVERDEVENYD